LPFSKIVIEKKIKKKSKEEAQEKIKELDMKEVLDKNKCWENPPTPLIDEADVNDADDDEDEEKGMSQSEMGELLQEVNSSEDEKAVASDISNLFSAGVISAKEKDSLIVTHKTAFKKVPSSTIPLSEETDKKS